MLTSFRDFACFEAICANTFDMSIQSSNGSKNEKKIQKVRW